MINETRFNREGCNDTCYHNYAMSGMSSLLQFSMTLKKPKQTLYTGEFIWDAGMRYALDGVPDAVCHIWKSPTGPA